MQERKIFVETYINHFDAFLARAYSITANEEDAKDIMQELAVIALRLEANSIVVQNPKAYLYRCIRNLAIDFLRQKKEVASDETFINNLLRVQDHSFEHTEQILFLEKLLNSFSMEMKEAFIRHYLEGETIVAIAQEMNISVTTLRKRLQRMKESIPKSAFFTLLYFLI